MGAGPIPAPCFAMKSEAIETANLPTWAAPYLINSDPSGLSDEEIQLVDEWVESLPLPDLGYHVFDLGEDSFFTWKPEFGAPCECVDCTIHLFTPET